MVVWAVENDLQQVSVSDSAEQIPDPHLQASLRFQHTNTEVLPVSLSFSEKLLMFRSL